MVRNELIISTLMEIKESIGSIEQHLVTLNGRVEKVEDKASSNTKLINKNSTRLARYGGAIGAVVIIIQIGSWFF